MPLNDTDSAMVMPQGKPVNKDENQQSQIYNNSLLLMLSIIMPIKSSTTDCCFKVGLQNHVWNKFPRKKKFDKSTVQSDSWGPPPKSVVKPLRGFTTLVDFQ